MSIIKITNAAISGSLLDSQIPNLATSKITSGTFADARIAASNVSQHATSFDDDKIVNDLSTLGLRVHTQENLNVSNTNSASFDVFNDANGITNLTNCSRDSDEFISSITSVNDANALEVFDADSLNTGDFTGQTLVGQRGDAKITEGSDNGQTVNADHPFSDGKSWQTDGYGGTNNGFFASAHTGSNASGWANFGSGAFTVEWFVKFIAFSAPSGHKYLYDWATGSDTNRMSMAFDSSGSRVNSFNGTIGIGYVSSGSEYGDFSTSAWRHVAWVRDSSNNLAQFVDGTRRGTGTGSTSLNYSSSSKLGILQRHESNTDSSTHARMANMRISNIARYDPTSSSITVPTSKLAIASTTSNATGSFEGVAITASASTSSMGAVITYQDNAGTNTLNTDIILKLSADNGSNYSTATLTALPDFATGIKMAKVNDLSVTAGTQLKYKIEFANQASLSK